MEKKQYLIALDLDGTLLTDDKEISSRNKQIIRKAMEEGHIVVIATGRPQRASIQYYHSLGLNTPMVNYNGAFTHHPQDDNWEMIHNPMPNRTALNIVDACYQFSVNNILAEVIDNVYIDQYDEQIIQIFQQTRQNSDYSFGDIRNNLKDDPTSLIIYPKEEHVDDLRSNLDGYADVIEHRKWGAPFNFIEIVKQGINKAVGLQKIAAYYQIPQERIIAFGDEDNDLEMIDYAGVGVAMGNAIDELKSISKHVTDTNEEDGVGIFLEEYLNIRIKTTPDL